MTHPLLRPLGPSLLALGWLASAQATSLHNQNGHAIDFEGYLRAGGGVSDGDTQTCFQAPGAGAKYRLGNECEIFIKPSLGYTYRGSDHGLTAPYLKLEARPVYIGNYGDEVVFDDYHERYVEVGNLLPGLPGLRLWGGRRYHDRKDLYINDFFYLDHRGDGFGFRDLPLPSGKLSWSHFHDDREPTGSIQDIRQTTDDLRWYGMPVNPGGELLVQLGYSSIEGEPITLNGAPATLQGAEGWNLSLLHTQQEWLGGTNKLALQYGQGALRNAGTSAFESPNALALLTTPSAAADLEDSQTWRLVEQHVIERPNWSMMTALVLEHRDSDSFDGTEQDWISLGVRPIWYLGEHLRAVVEAGIDRVEGNGADGTLGKLTLAAELTRKRGFWERPALRLYVTQASWSDAFKGQAGGPTFVNDTSGWNAGVQVEHWW